MDRYPYPQSIRLQPLLIFLVLFCFICFFFLFFVLSPHCETKVMCDRSDNWKLNERIDIICKNDLKMCLEFCTLHAFRNENSLFTSYFCLPAPCDMSIICCMEAPDSCLRNAVKRIATLSRFWAAWVWPCYSTGTLSTVLAVALSVHKPVFSASSTPITSWISGSWHFWLTWNA